MIGIKDSSNGETQENPEIKLKDIGYCCCFCSSLIEIYYRLMKIMILLNLDAQIRTISMKEK